MKPGKCRERSVPEVHGAGARVIQGTCLVDDVQHLGKACDVFVQDCCPHRGGQGGRAAQGFDFEAIGPETPGALVLKVM
jgi:hypothetical protein